MGACNSSEGSTAPGNVVPFSKTDKIAVIGAGAGGLHLASELIKKGKDKDSRYSGIFI